MATITNSICSNNKAINIQSGTGPINIGTNAAATAIIIGNTSGATGVTINLGSSGLVIPSFNSYGSLVNTSSGLISVATAGIAGTILTSNGTSSLPTYQNLTSANVPVDGTTISNTTNVHATGIFSSAISTAPFNSNVVTPGFTATLTAGTSIQNNLGYNILVNICVSVTSSTSATIVLGVGSATGPTTNTVIPSFTVAAATQFTFSAIVPNQYWLLVNTTGTIVVAAITTQSCGI